jgi:hypothetical protein
MEADCVVDALKGHGGEQSPQVPRLIEGKAAVIQSTKETVIDGLHEILWIDSPTYAVRQPLPSQVQQARGISFNDFSLKAGLRQQDSIKPF